MRILFIGDVVGDRGMEMLESRIGSLKQQYKPQVTIVNGENSTSQGRGITKAIFKKMMGMGVDVVTLGNHAWNNEEIYQFIDDTPKLIRPANYPDAPGNGYTIVNVNNTKLAVINIQGRVFLDTIDNPFTILQQLVDKLQKEVDYIFVDCHAEATSEKMAMAAFLDGKISALVGTHTHVQTNDAQILPKGTAFLSDVGMTGPTGGVLGMQAESVLSRFLNARPVRFNVVTTGDAVLGACVIDLSDKDGHAMKIKNMIIKSDDPIEN
ncbi:TIGR00282 family metallophosphoesterase [Lentilactobacillus senioris]|uniref:TIGR00282 family metallophosphoesterase n=1 Tax=Lentilactobacillus senioris TaxID=931534 RepID=UPI002280F930|nr:TIGR00282 family metallophosphoesterase [Lentilactobacillus senioris]MCY9807312.1 TIGR00282 family metallophosphoesterase [Lentilactobacillus senioris]